MQSYSFSAQFAYGHRPEMIQASRKILTNAIPSTYRVEIADKEDDIRGVDLWVYLQNGSRLAVDIKSLRQYPKWLCLETWSNVEMKKIGWTLNNNSLTDLVLWVWLEHRKTVILPYRQLMRVFKKHGREWKNEYPVKRQRTRCSSGNGYYHSECIMVPASVVKGCILLDCC